MMIFVHADLYLIANKSNIVGNGVNGRSVNGFWDF